MNRVMLNVVGVVSLLTLLAASANAGWRDEMIDGSTPVAFERSVAQLLNELPGRRREEFEMALAMIWIGNSVNVSNSESKAVVDLDELRSLAETAEDLLTEIRRGDVLSAFESRETENSGFTSLEYFELLDGFRFDDVVELADQLGREPDLREIRREVWCRESRPFIGTARAISQRCNDAAIHCPTGECVSQYAARALDASLDALQAGRYAEARAALENLDFARLTPYEQSKVEQRRAQVSYEEQDFPRMREHLLNAIYAGGLNEEQEQAFRRTIGRLDNALAAGSEPD